MGDMINLIEKGGVQIRSKSARVHKCLGKPSVPRRMQLWTAVKRFCVPLSYVSAPRLGRI
jgi:hypothetical protein